GGFVVPRAFREKRGWRHSFPTWVFSPWRSGGRGVKCCALLPGNGYRLADWWCPEALCPLWMYVDAMHVFPCSLPGPQPLILYFGPCALVPYVFFAGALYFHCFFLCIFCKSCRMNIGLGQGTLPCRTTEFAAPPTTMKTCVLGPLFVASSRYGLVYCLFLLPRRVRRIKGRKAGREETRSLYFPPNFLTSCAYGRRRCRSVIFWAHSLSSNGRSFCLQI
ncbi:unnamed protein product, partial [Ectocarpus sp. 8 AP-2014]